MRPPYTLDDIVQTLVSVHHFALTTYVEMERFKSVDYGKVCPKRFILTALSCFL